MRIASLAALAAALVASPALAQDRTGDALATAERLNDPVLQDGIARAVQAMAGVILDTRVGPLARLADPDGDIRPEDTLRELQGDPNFEARLYADTRRSTAEAGAVAGDMAAMLPELARTAARLQGALAGLGSLGGQVPPADLGGPDVDNPDEY